MRAGLIALATLATVLVIAPAALGFGGGGGRRGGGGGDFSASFVNGSQSGSGSGNAAGSAGGASRGLTAAEPLAALAVGLGLLGARYLRRR
jgi:hypothetical protein